MYQPSIPLNNMNPFSLKSDPTEIWRHVSDLKQMVGPVYEAETRHNYQGPEPHQEDLSSEVGPVYRVERRHSFQKGFSCEIDKKTVKVGIK